MGILKCSSNARDILESYLIAPALIDEQLEMERRCVSRGLKFPDIYQSWLDAYHQVMNTLDGQIWP